MKNKKIVLLFILFKVFTPTQFLYSQQDLTYRTLNNNIKELMYSNPEQAANITKMLLDNHSIKLDDLNKINLISAKIYKVKGDYSASLKFLFDQETKKRTFSNQDKISIALEKTAIFRELSLNKEAKAILKTLENDPLKQLIGNEFLNKIAVAIEKASFLLNEQKYSQGISTLENAVENENKFGKHPEAEISYRILLGQLYFGADQLSTSKTHFEKAILLINNSNYTDNFHKTFAQIGLADIYFNQKNHQEAIKLLLQAYDNSIGLQNIYLQETVLKKLSINYLAIKDVLNHKLTSINLIKHNAEIEKLEQNAINTAYNLISQEQSENNLKKQSNYYNITYVMIALAVLFLSVLFFLWWRLYQKKKRLKEIINYLNVTRNNFINLIPVKVEEIKKINIPKETEQMLLKKLEKFENSTKFTNKDISLAVLAGQFDTNTKYLSEVINSNFNINFNTYINKLRINYIVEKLKNDSNFMSYKISYLAENCGFSSHSSFATVFKSVTGISPITFIELLRKEKEDKTNLEDV